MSQDFASEHRKVALFGGAYSNWLATLEVIRDAKSRGADGIWFLGDAGAFGPHPDRTIDVLREHEIPSIQGNYDDSVGNSRADCACGYTDPRDNHFAQISYDYTLENTSRERREWLASLPKSALLQVGGKRLALCHGSPRKVNEFLWESTTPECFVASQCQQLGVDAVACTHTGLHWARWLQDGRGIVNVGAIGRPANDGRNEVWYAMIELEEGRLKHTFIPVSYPWQHLAEEMEREGLPAEFVETIRTGFWTTCLEILPARERMRGRH